MTGPETLKANQRRINQSFFTKYMSGLGLDIGYKAGKADRSPVLDSATGVDLDYPGYDGMHLPFEDGSQDYVYASHVLEHIENHYIAITEWFRVLKQGGNLIICVPHQYLYEKKWDHPSQYNPFHLRYYTPSTLLHEVEQTLLPNSYRVRYLCDNDGGYNYQIAPEQHAIGEYQIECVIQKIKKPDWELI